MERTEELSRLLTEDGFAEAVNGLRRLLFYVSYSVLGDRESCADAVQNALLKAWSKRSSLRDPGKFKSWLVKIVLNESKALAMRPRTCELNEAMPAEDGNTDERADVKAAVMRLKEKYRTPVILYYYEDMTVDQIADALGLPKGTVVSQLSRAREQLRKELRDYDE